MAWLKEDNCFDKFFRVSWYDVFQANTYDKFAMVQQHLGKSKGYVVSFSSHALEIYLRISQPQII